MFLKDIKLSIILLQSLGIYPSSQVTQRGAKKDWVVRWCDPASWVLLSLTVFYIAFSLGRLILDSIDFQFCLTIYGFWNGFSLLKLFPILQDIYCIGILVCFLALHRIHHSLHQKLWDTDYFFREEFAITVTAKKVTCKLMTIIYLVIVPCIVISLSQIVLCGDYESPSFKTLIFVPNSALQSLWLVVPLCYFHVFHGVVRYWNAELQKKLERKMTPDPDPERFVFHSLESFVNAYFNLLDAISGMNAVFNLFLFLTVAKIMLKIVFGFHLLHELQYIVRIAGISDYYPKNRIYYEVSWTILQVPVWCVLATFVIFWNGIKTNEQVAGTKNVVLKFKCQTDDERFQVYRFQEKAKETQDWCVTAGKALRISRKSLFWLGASLLVYVTFTHLYSQQAPGSFLSLEVETATLPSFLTEETVSDDLQNLIY